MGTFHWARWTAGAVCAVLMASVAVTPASAQFRPAQERERQGGFTGPAYERGFQEGLRQGELDARRGRVFDPYGHQVYRDGARGYDWRFGDRGTYVTVFRRGFEEGYREGHRRARGGAVGRQNGRGPGGFPGRGRTVREPAVQRGFNDGYERGLSDGRDGDRYDPVATRDYRDGDNGYSRSYGGTRDDYKNNYRTGFRQGYEDGYRDGVRYDRR